MRRTFAYTQEGLPSGAARGLCVVTSWEDSDGNTQYGPVSLAWAATAPLQGASPAANSGLIVAGPKDDSNRKTNAIDWFIQVDRGYEYNVRVISGRPGSTLDCSTDTSGTSAVVMSGNENDDDRRYRHSGISTYTTYAACLQAKNGQGESAWTTLTSYSSLPGAPPAPSFQTGASDLTAGGTGRLVWRFSPSSASFPENPSDYDAVVFRWTGAASDRKSPTQAICTAGSGTDYTSVTDAISETGSGFEITVTDSTIATAGAYYFYTCANAQLGSTSGTPGRTANTDGDGPWSIGSATVTTR